MDIKILTSVAHNSYNKRTSFIIGTHNGIFHSDEVVAIAILCLLHENEEIQIVRTRAPDILSSCDICVDVGGGNYDHHQAGFSKWRCINIPYASAGLVWKDFGNSLVCKYLAKLFPEDLEHSFNIWKKFDDEIIYLVDCEDNGIKTTLNHCFSYIPSFHPVWNDRNTNFENQFLRVLHVTISVLQHQLFQTISDYMSESILRTRWKESGDKYFSNNILEIPSQTIPWVESVITFNDYSNDFEDADIINFVIFEYPAGGWAAQCVPPSLDNKFCQRIPFPKEWAGQTDKLPQISQVPDATFCHNGRFFARSKTKDGIIKMCKLAMSLHPIS